MAAEILFVCRSSTGSDGQSQKDCNESAGLNQSEEILQHLFKIICKITKSVESTRRKKDTINTKEITNIIPCFIGKKLKFATTKIKS